jgi:3-(3-hydroxy-phenyl)propionate hydroxylase
MQLNDLASVGGEPLDYQKLAFDYVCHPDQAAAAPVRHPVVVVGAGPVGLALAVDLAQQQVPVVLLDNDNRLSCHLFRQALARDFRPARLRGPHGCQGRVVEPGPRVLPQRADL